MQQNVGTWDAYLRLVIGFFFLGLGATSRHRARSLLYLALGANKVAEGITRHCPVLGLLGLNTLSPADRRAMVTAPSRDGYGQLAHNPYLSSSGDGFSNGETFGSSGGKGDSEIVRKDARGRLRFPWRREAAHPEAEHPVGFSPS